MDKPYFIELKGQLEHGGIKSKSDWAIVGRVDIPKLVADIDSLSEENKRLREALGFYANEKTYKVSINEQWGPSCPIDIDEGKLARQALGGETN